MNPSIFNNCDLETRFSVTMEWGFSLNKFKINDMIYVRYAIHDFFAVLVLRASDNKVLELTGYSHEKPEMADHKLSQNDFFLYSSPYFY